MLYITTMWNLAEELVLLIELKVEMRNPFSSKSIRCLLSFF